MQGAFRNELRPRSEASDRAFQGSGSTDGDHLRLMPDLRHGNSLLYTGIQDRNLGPINLCICSGFNEYKSLDNSLLFLFATALFVLGTSLRNTSFYAITARFVKDMLFWKLFPWSPFVVRIQCLFVMCIN